MMFRQTDKAQSLSMTRQTNKTRLIVVVIQTDKARALNIVSQRLGRLGKIGASKEVRKQAEVHMLSNQEGQGDQLNRLKDRM